MKRFLVVLAMLMVSFVSSAEVNNKDPYAMVQQVADSTFNRLKTEHEVIRSNPNLLKAVIKEELLPYINYRYAALKVLGGYYKKFPKNEVDDFALVFRDYIVTSYAQIFTLYNGQKVSFEHSKDFSSNKIVSVSTQVLINNAKPITIDFKVRKNKKTGEWKAYDLIAEGISFLDSKKAELNSIIRQKGLVSVTNMLKEKSTRDITFKKKGS